MKFKQFLFEDKPKFQDILKNISNECSEFIKESGGYPLYRGQKLRNPTYKYETQEIRKNKDSNTKDVGLFNLYAERKFKIKNFRNENVMFATGEQDTNPYGPTMFVFPCNGYQYLWSPIVRDFLGRTHIIRRDVLRELIKTFNHDLNEANYIIDKVDMAIVKEWPPTIKKIVLSPITRLQNGKNAYVLLRDALSTVYDDIDYQMKYLKSAIESENEIMFKTKFYYGIDPSTVVEYFQMDEETKYEELYTELYDYLEK